VVKHWNRLPKEAVGAPSMKAFKAGLDVTGQPGLVVGAPAHSRGVQTWMITVVLVNPGHSMIL